MSIYELLDGQKYDFYCHLNRDGCIGALREKISHLYHVKKTNTYMKVQQVYARHTELLQRIVRGLRDILRIAVDDAVILIVIAKLGRDEDTVTLASTLQPFADQLFVVVIDVGGVPESAPAFAGSVQDLRMVKIDKAIL